MLSAGMLVSSQVCGLVGMMYTSLNLNPDRVITPAIPTSGMHTGAAARMATSPLASDIAAGAEAFGASGGAPRTPSATSVSNAELPTAQQAGQDGAADGAAGSSAGRSTPAQQGYGQQGLGPASPPASQSSIAGAPSSAAVQEGSGTRAAGVSQCHAAAQSYNMMSQLLILVVVTEMALDRIVVVHQLGRVLLATAKAADTRAYYAMPDTFVGCCSARLDGRPPHCVSGPHPRSGPRVCRGWQR